MRHLRAYLRSPSRREFLQGLAAEASLLLPLAHFLEHCPGSPADRRETISKELDALDVLILLEGPCDAAVRSHIRARAGAVAASFDLEKPQNITDRFLLIRARELLRDVGVEAPLDRHTASILFGHARAAVCFFEEVGEFSNLARALIALGNTYRLVEDQRRAAQKFLWAFHILNERCDLRESTVALLQHQVKFWRLRCVGQDFTRSRIRTEIADLTQLARRVNESSMWVEHYREEAGFSSYLLGDSDAANEHLEQLSRARRQLTRHTAYADPTLLTPKIELLFETGRKEEAVQLIKDQYVPQYLRHRHHHYHSQISRWRANHRFDIGFDLPSPEYASAYLSYLPRGGANSCDDAGDARSILLEKN